MNIFKISNFRKQHPCICKVLLCTVLLLFIIVVHCYPIAEMV